MKNVTSIESMLSMLLMVCTAGVFAAPVKVYNGSPSPIAVAIVQGVWDGLFRVRPDTLRVKGFPERGWVKIYTIKQNEVATIERPARTIGKDTVIIVDQLAGNLKNRLERGESFGADYAYTIGQMGNKEIFLAPYAYDVRGGKAFPGVLKQLMLTVLFKSYNYLAKAVLSVPKTKGEGWVAATETLDVKTCCIPQEVLDREQLDAIMNPKKGSPK